jgi:hypothetical protein
MAMTSTQLAREVETILGRKAFAGRVEIGVELLERILTALSSDPAQDEERVDSMALALSELRFGRDAHGNLRWNLDSQLGAGLRADARWLLDHVTPVTALHSQGGGE